LARLRGLGPKINAKFRNFARGDTSKLFKLRHYGVSRDMFATSMTMVIIYRASGRCRRPGAFKKRDLGPQGL